jgi:hypothetical protein
MRKLEEVLPQRRRQRTLFSRRGSGCTASSGTATHWQAALSKHAASHAFLSDMLIDGRPGVAKDVKRVFKLAKAGAAFGCAHSKGALGRCYVVGNGVVDCLNCYRKDVMKDTDNDDVAVSPSTQSWRPTVCLMARPSLSVMTKARPIHAHPDLLLQ